jgi:hypothetical protein
MAISTNSTPTTELSHLTIEDLLGPMPDTFRLGGPGPFVINLRSSSVALALPAADIEIAKHGHVYQIQRREEDAIRYRLRLGPFTSEDDADALLTKVRELYPSALTARATPEDLRVIDGLGKNPAIAAVPAAPAPAPAAPVPAVTAPVAPAPVSATPVGAAAVAPVALAPAAVAPAAPVAPVAVATMRQPVPVRTASTVAPRSPIPPVASHMPTARVAIPVTAPTPVKAPAKTPTAATSTVRTTLPSFDSTQTLRRLSPIELESEGGLRWYVIQLSLSDSPVDPETVPILDIFTLYRLYTVSGLEDGRVMHALRLGFFAEQIAASAVANYLAAYYDKPVIKRVSVAERERFSTQNVEARKDIGATGTHTAIEITSDLVVRQRRTTAS